MFSLKTLQTNTFGTGGVDDDGVLVFICQDFWGTSDKKVGNQ